MWLRKMKPDETEPWSALDSNHMTIYHPAEFVALSSFGTHGKLKQDNWISAKSYNPASVRLTAKRDQYLWFYKIKGLPVLIDLQAGWFRMGTALAWLSYLHGEEQITGSVFWFNLVEAAAFSVACWFPVRPLLAGCSCHVGTWCWVMSGPFCITAL